jgi:hypothetical protein
MKYLTFIDDVISILHSSDHNFKLKFYDVDGNLTTNTDNILWLHIDEPNIIINTPTDDNPVISLWKSNDDFGKEMKIIIQRIRELSILNGIKVQVKQFNNLDRRKIYNLIKNTIKNNKEDEMNESVINDLSRVLFEVSTNIRNTKKASDLYISESLHNTNIKTLIENNINSILSYKGLNDKKIKSLLSKTLLESSLNDIKNIVKVFYTKHIEEFNRLYENKDIIKNINVFNKQRYLNNIEYTDTPNVMLFLENVKVYAVKQKNDKENLKKAYNHLISVCENVKTGIDILRVIRKHNLCETYSVSKNDLLDMWLSNSLEGKIVDKKLIVVENFKGEKILFNEEVLPSIKLISKKLNENFHSEELVQNIVDETIKFNHLTNLIENHLHSMGMEKYSKLLNKIYKDCSAKLNENVEINQNFLDPVDYSKELSLLESSLGFKHPGLKYIALEQALLNECAIIDSELEKSHDIKILKECLSSINSSKKSEDIASSIVNEGVFVVKEIPSINDTNKIIKHLYNNLHSLNENVNVSISDYLFYLNNNPHKNNIKKNTFIKTIKKYII